MTVGTILILNPKFHQVMTAFYKILVLFVGIAFPFNLWAQSQSDLHKNTTEAFPAQFDKRPGISDFGNPSIEYRACNSLKDDFQFFVLMSIPADSTEINKMNSVSDDADNAENVFVEFCKELVKWDEETSAKSVSAIITVIEYSPESYEAVGTGKAVSIEFRLPPEKLTIENLREQNNRCIFRYALEHMMPNPAVVPAPAPKEQGRNKRR